MCRSEGEGEEYSTEVEDGRPCIKSRKQQTMNTTGSKEETVEEGEEKEIGRGERNRERRKK